MYSVHKKGCTDLQEVPNEDEKSWSYGATLQTDSSFTSPCSWAAADPSTFLIRGENYLKDHRKVFFQFHLFLKIKLEFDIKLGHQVLNFPC